MMKPHLLAIALLLVLPTTGQDHTRTVNNRTPGERTLQLTGIFTGSDSALVQVYHDGKELLAEPAVRTWSITLGAHEHYTIKFTDPTGRTKRIAVHELSDDMVEFYPPIEIDFDRTGNLVLIKQSTGKPDWLEYDVGMSRKRRKP